MKKRYTIDYNQIEDLKEMGYELKQFTPYHFRVTSKDGEKTLDFFPTSRKYFTTSLDNGYMGKGEYEDLLEIVEKKLDTFI